MSATASNLARAHLKNRVTGSRAAAGQPLNLFDPIGNFADYYLGRESARLTRITPYATRFEIQIAFNSIPGLLLRPGDGASPARVIDGEVPRETGGQKNQPYALSSSTNQFRE